ncbi:MAG: hypothetical protein KF835_15145 [Xanthobacteraceae bacterium]|nr:hypothetical protein [Xanthobacteraceae bacterium]
MPPAATPLKQALHDARIEAAERSAVIIELRDAEMARLEILNEAVDKVFKEIPARHTDYFDRGVSGGVQPRLWIDAITHVAMGPDKRTYRLLTDTANGRRVLEENTEVPAMREAITRYVARRMVAREQALATTEASEEAPRKSGWKTFFAFLFGALCGAAALFAAVWFTTNP